MSILKSIARSAGAAVLAAVFAASAMAQTEITFGHVGGPTSLFNVSAERFAEIANERLPEDYRVVVYHSSQLGNDSELLQKLRLGTVHLALPSTIMSSVADEFGLFELPYLVRDREHMKRIEKEIFWPSLHPIVEQQNYKVLAVWENGFRNITNNVRPIVTPDDLQGIKLRTPSGVWRVRMFEAYGASPSPMELSEVFMALQTGVMDGQENPLTQITGQRSRRCRSTCR
jgi:TRAP-type transport system periplasmic protein